MTCKFKPKDRVRLSREAKEQFKNFQKKPLTSGCVSSVEFLPNVGWLVTYSSRYGKAQLHEKFLEAQLPWCKGFSLASHKQYDELDKSQMEAARHRANRVAKGQTMGGGRIE